MRKMRKMHFIQQNNVLKIETTNPEIEIVAFSLFRNNGQLIYSGKTNQYNLNSKLNTSLIFGVVNYRFKSKPNGVKTLSKAITLF